MTANDPLAEVECHTALTKRGNAVWVAQLTLS